MNKKTFIGGTFAAVAAIVAASSFISCSSDDEYYEGGNYTLANRRMSRSSIEGDDVPVTPPDHLLSYEPGSTTHEICFEGLRIPLNVSWNGGNWRTMGVTVSQGEVVNMGGYQEYWDELGVYHNVNNIEFSKLEWDSKIQVHIDCIDIHDMRIYFRKKEEFTMKNGGVGYRMGAEQSYPCPLGIDISSYRTDK